MGKIEGDRQSTLADKIALKVLGHAREGEEMRSLADSVFSRVTAMHVSRSKTFAALGDAECVIMTVERPAPPDGEAYIHRTMHSLGGEVPVRFFVGSHASAYLDRYRSRADVSILETTLEQQERMQDWPLTRRASWNYWRILSADSRRPLVAFEDDVLFARGWAERLRRTIEAVERESGDGYILALYTGHGFIVDPFRRGELFAKYPVPEFYGNQGVYFTPRTRAGFAAHLKRWGVDVHNIPHDLLLRDYVSENGIPLYATCPSLVQHMGEVTTGLASFHHQSPAFREDLTSL